jgi:ribosome-binding protein aMBF1 (putative translation factor)
MKNTMTASKSPASTRAAKPIKIAIQDNNCYSRSPCPICGTEIKPDVGPQLFLAGTWEPVCEDCAKIHSPQIFALWQHAQKQRQQLESRRQEEPA